MELNEQVQRLRAALQLDVSRCPDCYGEGLEIVGGKVGDQEQYAATPCLTCANLRRVLEETKP